MLEEMIELYIDELLHFYGPYIKIAIVAVLLLLILLHIKWIKNKRFLSIILFIYICLGLIIVSMYTKIQNLNHNIDSQFKAEMEYVKENQRLREENQKYKLINLQLEYYIDSLLTKLETDNYELDKTY